MKNLFRKLCVTCGLAVCSLLTFAEGEVTHYISTDPDQNGINAFTQLKNDLVAWSGDFLPIVLSVVGIFLVYWLIKFGLRVFKSFASAGK